MTATQSNKPNSTKFSLKRKVITPKKEINRITGFPTKPLSVIICPFPQCTYYCVSRQEQGSLVDMFEKHIRTEHKISPTRYCLDYVQSKINEFKTFKKYSYVDPFIYVPLEDVTRDG